MKKIKKESIGTRVERVEMALKGMAVTLTWLSEQIQLVRAFMVSFF